MAVLDLLENGDILMLALITGACLGSFANMLIHRLPEDEETVRTPSHCPHCGHRLKLLNLIPILSYIIQRGKCSFCHTPYGARYLWVELASTMLFGAVALLYGVTWLATILCLTGLCLIVLIAIDLRHMLIPDAIQIPLIFLGIAHAYLLQKDPLQVALLCAFGLALGFGLRALMQWWKKREGLGLGDVKFMCVAGLFLDWNLIGPFYFIAGIAGILTVLATGRDGEGHFPFGPALALSLFLCAAFPDAISGQFQQMIEFVVEFSLANIDNGKMVHCLFHVESCYA